MKLHFLVAATFGLKGYSLQVRHGFIESAFHAASSGMDLFPAGWRIVRRHDANCFYFVNLAAPYFVDVH